MVVESPLRAAVRQGRVLAGVAGLVVLTGCVDEAERFMAAPEVSAGGDVEGELTSSSPVNLNDGTRYSAHWLCGASDSGAMRYELEAPFAATLSAFDAQGRWLGSAENAPEGEGATLLAVPRAEACTLLVVNGQGSGAFGPYRLAAEAASDEAALVPGRPLVGVLDGASTEYSLSFENPARLNLSASGGEGLGLRLVGEGVTHRAQACAPGELRLEAYVEAGDYQVRLEPREAAMDKAPSQAASCGRHLLSTGGAYRLLAEQRDLSDGRRNGGPLRDGDRITGSLAEEAPNVYELTVDEPTSVMLSLRSSAFDTLLRIRGAGSELSDDDGGGGTDSRLQTVLMPGEYRVEVDRYGVGLGDYTLQVERQAFDGEFRNDGPITLGQSLEGMLGAGRNHYQFEVAETSEVELALDSNAFDPMLRLHGNGVEISDDDSGGNRNALITTVLQPGAYTLDVESYSGSGAYRLRTEQSVFEGRMSSGGEIALGEVVYGQLPTGGSLTYQLVVASARDVVLESTSTAVDTVMRLSGNGVNARNDDAGDLGLGSRIRRHLEAGTYRVEVSAFGSSSGMVRLSTGG